MDLLTYEEAADLLGVKRGTLYAWVSEKRIPHVRLSARCVRFEKPALLEWVAKRRVRPSSPPRPRGS